MIRATSKPGCEHWLPRKERFGSLPSALVLNAAMGGADVVGDVETVTMERWRAVFEVNVIGSVLGLRACLPGMVAAGTGAVVIMGSVDSFLAEQGAVAYSCTKATLLQLGRCVAMDYARRGIRVNVLCAGIVDTPGFRSHLSTASDPARFEAYRTARQPIGRFLESAEIAGVVSFLLGPDCLVDDWLGSGGRWWADRLIRLPKRPGGSVSPSTERLGYPTVSQARCNGRTGGRRQVSRRKRCVVPYSPDG